MHMCITQTCAHVHMCKVQICRVQIRDAFPYGERLRFMGIFKYITVAGWCVAV
jgi:hypothetical protein